MADSWITKDGMRRVRHDPPTLHEAIQAAQGVTADRDQQIRFAADLMGLSEDDTRAEMRRVMPIAATTKSLVAATRDKGSRTVLVERRVSRRRIELPTMRSGSRSPV